MKEGDKKRLLKAWLLPKNKRILFKLAVRYARVFREKPEDLLQRTFEILLRRDKWELDNVLWRAQDAMQNLAANRKRSFAYKSEVFFANRPHDDEEEDRDDEARVRGDFPDPEAALIERETVETYRAFIKELKAALAKNAIALRVLSEGEDESYDTEDIKTKLKNEDGITATREQIYDARRAIKDKAIELRNRWRDAGRELPGFPGVK